MRTVYRFEEFELDPAEARLARAGARVVVQPKVLDALRLFVEQPGRLIPKEELLERLWPGVFVSEESLTQVVRKLRLALDDDPQSPRFLATVPRRGYRFLPPVTRLEAASATPTTVSAAVAPAVAIDVPAQQAPESVAAAVAPAGAQVSDHPFHGRSWPWVAALLCVLAVAWVAAIGWKARSWTSAAPRADGEPALRRITATPGRETYPAISRDGERYAYVLRPVGEDQLDLYVAAIGGEPVRLTATATVEFAPQFSPDGSELLFSRREGGRDSVWRIPVLGGAPVAVAADATEGAWTPDGRAVLVVRPQPGPRDSVRRIELEGGGELELWSWPGGLASLAVSPDGERVAAVAGERQIVVGAATAATAAGEARVLAGPLEYLRSLAWEPDGRALVADGSWPGNRGGLVRVPIDGGAPEPLTSGARGIYHPTLTRDGSILYALEHKVREIVRLDAEFERGETLPTPVAVECFDVAPGGASLAVSDWDAPPGRGTLSVLAVEDGVARALGDGLCPAFSPDGASLAFLGHRADEMGLWQLDLASGEKRRIAPDRGAPGLIEGRAARRPAWSPDGARVAYVGGELPEGEGIYLVDLATSERTLVAPGLSGQLAWSPDGSRLAVAGDGPELGLAVVDLDRRVVRRVLAAGAYRASPVWLAADRLGLLVDQQSRPALAVVDVTSGAEVGRHAIAAGREPSFWGIFELVPDRRGGWLAVVETYESDLYLLDRRPAAR